MNQINCKAQKFIALVVCLVLVITNLNAQELANEVYSHSNYDWEEIPVLYELNEEELKASAVIVKDNRIVEYAYGNDDGLYLFETAHKIVRVNDDQGVEGFNKVVVPMSNVLDFVVLKARAISPDGKITVLDRDKIKELENVGDWGALKIFAIEGLEKGGEVEYLYTTKGQVREPYGREFMQSETKMKEAGFTLISPSNLIFEAKAYNGFPELILTEENDSRILNGVAVNLPALLEEDYSNYRANLARVAYKLRKNDASKNGKDLYTWELAAETFSELIYSYSNDDAKKIKKIIKKEKLNKGSVDQKVRKIDTYIKNNYTLEEGSGAEFTSVGSIVKNKYANEVGMSRMMAAMLDVSEINHNMVVTSNRFQTRFDSEFEDWGNFTDIIFYIPDTKKYLAATMIEHRYGEAPYHFANNYGLFVNKAKKTAEVAFIEMPNAEYSTNRIDANVTFNENFQPILDMEYGWTGYRAAMFRAFYKYQEGFIDERMKSGMTDADLGDVAVFNESMEDTAFPNKEFYAKGRLSNVNSLIEKAGKNYLFKIGDIIGDQVELYQEHERINPIDMQYPTYYKRTITFEVPKGYKLAGLEEAKIDKFVEVEGKKVCRFLSDYTVKGNTVTVTADEYYQKIALPKNDYEAFRGVINGAADFNKIVLVFEKE